jgi:hypothetical protein
MSLKIDLAAPADRIMIAHDDKSDNTLVLPLTLSH